MFTKKNGRLTARANGVRRLKSRRGAGLMPLHRIQVNFEERSAGLNIVAVHCLDTFKDAWDVPESFFRAEQGIETVLRLTEEKTPLPEIYELTRRFLSICREPHARFSVAVFSLKLLFINGLLPSATHSAVSHLPFSSDEALVISRFGGLSRRSEEQGGIRVSPELKNFLVSVPGLDLECQPRYDQKLLRETERFIQGLLGNQLGVELKSSDAVSGISPRATPI